MSSSFAMVFKNSSEFDDFSLFKFLGVETIGYRSL
jgi:hypothetical protein